MYARAGIGFDMGTWKPSKLKEENTSTPLGVPGGLPFYRIYVTTPQLGDWILRLSCGYWGQSDIENQSDVQSIGLTLLMCELKHRIVPQSRFTPFASYGLTVFLGSESPENKHYQWFNPVKEVGYGFNVGTGFDCLFFRKWIATVEFCYHFVRFQEPVGLTNDYSGPRITAGFSFVL